MLTVLHAVVVGAVKRIHLEGAAEMVVEREFWNLFDVYAGGASALCWAFFNIWVYRTYVVRHDVSEQDVLRPSEANELIDWTAPWGDYDVAPPWMPKKGGKVRYCSQVKAHDSLLMPSGKTGLLRAVTSLTHEVETLWTHAVHEIATHADATKDLSHRAKERQAEVGNRLDGVAEVGDEMYA